MKPRKLINRHTNFPTGKQSRPTNGRVHKKQNQTREKNRMKRMKQMMMAFLLLSGVAVGQTTEQSKPEVPQLQTTVINSGVVVGQTTEQSKVDKVSRLQTTVTDYFGVPRDIWDPDQDGWDDLWCAIYGRDLKHRSVYVDTDSDGVTDYDEMILWRDPFGAEPLPRKLTDAEKAEAVQKAEVARIKQLAEERIKWAAFKNDKAKALNGTKVIDKAKLVREEQEKHNAMLKKAKNVKPVWIKPHNAEGVLKAGISQLHVSPVQQFTGAGQTIASIEPRIPHPHPALANRVEWTTYFGTLAQPDGHSTRILGTMIGDGTNNPLAKGAAPDALVQMYRTAVIGFSYPKAAQEHGVSNTSNGTEVGWGGSLMTSPDGTEQLPYWVSRLSVSALEPNYCGLYTVESGLVDEAMTTHPLHISVFSAGNEGHQIIPVEDGDFFYADNGNGVEKYQVIDGNAPGKAGANDEGFDTLAYGFATAKNPLVVGGINSNDSPYEFGSKGPTDDGRIKPDVVAKASIITTTDGYQGFSESSHGTSYSSAIITGGIAVMQQATQAYGVQPYKGATKKALVIHEAYDLGEDGPDYMFGWGSPVFVNTVNLIKENKEKGGSPFIKETFVTPNSPVKISVMVGQPRAPRGAVKRPLKVTIAWTDPEGPVPLNVMNTKDVRSPVLVHDLNLKVIQVVNPGEPVPDPFLPWVLDVEHPAVPATKGVNNRDNVEQVLIDDAFGEYIIEVSVGALQEGIGSQDVSMVITGIRPEDSISLPAGGHVVPSGGDLNELFLSWNAPVGVDYALESSVDLVTWVTEVENLVTNNEEIGYIAPMAPGPNKFWRLRW